MTSNSREGRASLGRLLAVLVAGPALLAGVPPAQASSPGSSTPLQRAEETFNSGKMDEARAQYDAILANAFVTPRDRAVAQCRKGLILSLKGGFNEALPLLEKALQDKLLTGEAHSSCTFALLQILVLKDRPADAVALLDSWGEPQLSTIYQARAWALGAESARKAGNSAREVVYLQRLLQVMDSTGITTVPLRILGKRVVSLAEVRQRLGLETQGAAAAPAALGQGQQPVTQANPSAGANSERIVQLVQFLSGAISETKRGSWVAARNRWQLMDERNMQDSLAQLVGFAPPLALITRRLSFLASSDPRNLRIGLLVPADPELASVSHRILRAASAFLASPGTKGADVTTHVRAAAADPGAIERAALDLVLQDQVTVIIGPVSSGLVLGAAPVSELFGVPLFALGPVAETIGSSHDLVVRMGVLAESQTRVLAEEARATQLANVAILAPNDAYGVEMAQAMARAATSHTLPVGRTTYYDATSDVFKDGVQAALGPQDDTSRPEEHAKAIEQARLKAASERRKFDPSEVKLPALVPFDGIFVPDTLRRARIIASTFAYFEARGLRFLGDRQWSTTDSRKSMADEFVSGARVPVPLMGRYGLHLLTNLGIVSPRGLPEHVPPSLDLERQVFDSLLLSRQGQYLANGLNGYEMVSRLRSQNWKLEATTRISGVTASGEPVTDFALRAFRQGALSDDLPSWSGETWREDLAAWSQGRAQKPADKAPKTRAPTPRAVKQSR